MINQKINSQIGLRLKECRELRHLTQNELADLCFCSPQTISYIENGKRGASRNLVHKFAEILKVREEYILLESEFMTHEDEMLFTEKVQDSIDSAAFDYLNSLGHNILFKANDNREVVMNFFDYCSENNIKIPKQALSFKTYSNEVDLYLYGHAATVRNVNVVIDGVTEVSLVDYLDMIEDLNSYADFLISKIAEKRERRIYHIAVDHAEQEAKKESSIEDKIQNLKKDFPGMVFPLAED